MTPAFRPRVERLELRDNPAISFRLDYSYDALGYFNDTTKRQVLQKSADDLAALFQDTLSTIVPSGGDTWRVQYRSLVNNQLIDFRNATIPANQIPIYIMAAPLGGSELGLAASGSVSASGSSNWLRTVFGRGQPGASTSPASDYGPWGGFITFDSQANWSFSQANPAANQFDFVSVANHEMTHLLGFSPDNASFARFISAGRFTGPSAVAANGGVAIPLTADGHWQQGTQSDGRSASMNPTSIQGQNSRLTSLDVAALKDIGWQTTAFGSVVASPSTPVLAVSPTTTPSTDSHPAPLPSAFAVGSDLGGQTARLLNPDRSEVLSLQPFDAGFTGGTRVAVGDFNGDGFPDLVVGTGPGIVTRVRIFDGVTKNELFAISPFEAGFTGGVFVAAGDITGDGRADLVITPDEGGGPRVRIFRGGDFNLIADFLGIDDPTFRGGARAAVGDVNGDRTLDLVVAAGFGGGPRIATFDGKTISSSDRKKLGGDFAAFENELRNGVYVTVGDLDGDGKAEIIAGAGPGGGPRVSSFDGASVTAGQPKRVVDFISGDPANRAGLRVAVKNLDGDTRSDLLVGPGTGAGGQIAGYAGRLLNGGTNPPVDFLFEAIPGVANGVYVG